MVKYYSFECCNHDGMKSAEESQRTRMFLFSAIAFSLCYCFNKKSFFIYENGMTSMNLSKQADMINARSSRTTHPKTLELLLRLYRLLDSSFEIIAPYYNNTKAEIVEVFKTYESESIIALSVSCSSTRRKAKLSPHCGSCSQCIDRRLSLYAAGLEDYDAPAYSVNFINEFPDSDKGETEQRIYNTLRLANLEEISSLYDFYEKYPDDVTNLAEYWPGSNNIDDKLDEIYDLVCRYGKGIIRAATRIRNKHDDITKPINKNSLLGIVSERKYFKSPIAKRVDHVDEFLRKTIALMFQSEEPKNEQDLNDKIEAILKCHGDFSREYPTLQFWRTAYKPDHAQDYLLLEAKYIRGATVPSKVIEGIAADMTKAPLEAGLMFVVYDPSRQIPDDEHFICELESRRKECFVRVFR
jgi:hypothetical protein